MAKRITKLTRDELIERERFSRALRDRIAERRALEAEWERQQEAKRSLWPFRRWSRGQARA
jgi:flagellar biosynthesis chaperone FliJ